MSEQEKMQRGKRRTKIILITVTVLFIVLMLVVPLISVITSALKEGFKFYLQRKKKSQIPVLKHTVYLHVIRKLPPLGIVFRSPSRQST